MSALLLSALPGSAFAQVMYVPYTGNQPVYVAQPAAPAQAIPQQAVPQQAPVQQYVYMAQPSAPAPAARQQYYVYVTQPRYASSAPPSYAPAAAPAYTGSVPARAAAPSYTGTVTPRPAVAAVPAYIPAAAPAPAAPAVPPIAVASSSSGGGGFLSAIFGGPTIDVRSYQTAPAPQPVVVTPPPVAYAPSSQGDMANYPIDPKFNRQLVEYRGEEKPGTIVIDTPNKFLYLVEDGGRALRYGIGVGRPGFTWAGVKEISAMREWPDWRPPADMLQRRPDLPRYMPGGIDNPLGARAMYLGSTLYRIHGSNEPWTIGTNVSSGCIRMRNDDVTDLYNRVKIGTKVVVI